MRAAYFDAKRFSLPTVQMIQPNGRTNHPIPQGEDLICLSFMKGESLYLADTNTITWNGTGLTGTLKLELLVNGLVAGTIAENLPATQTSYPWQVGKTLTGWVNPGTNFKVRVSTNYPPTMVDKVCLSRSGSALVPAITTTTYYFYDYGGRLLAEYDSSGVCVKDYIYNGSKLLAEYQPSGSKYYYYTSDQINSTRIITDSSGAVVSSSLYDPYGGLQKVWVDTYHPKPGFSGKEREASTELDYFGARYYGHKQYRFLSVDPEINKEKALGNPQYWNLYAYCDNNPISKFDPDGRESNFGSHWFYSQGNNAGITGEFLQNHPVAFATASIAGLAAPFVGPVLMARIASLIGPAEKVVEKYGNSVYQSINSAGEVQYVGITNNLARRAAEHLSSKGIQIQEGISDLSRSAARAVEQALIEIHGLGESGGTLLNKINSISTTNPKYVEGLQKGSDLLKKGGYL
jgi:RHS repeat-associated protein